MTKTYCLTIEVESKTITNGLGYMVAFNLPDDDEKILRQKGFQAWADQVKDAVLSAGDAVYDCDPYTKKLAIAELMNELADLNAASPIQIAGDAEVPAVQIQSSNPYDNRIEIDFTDADGHYSVIEKGLADLERRTITAHGATGLVDGTRRHFPFTQQPPAFGVPKVPKPPALRP
ncbi:MAG TPA: hypothetical protein VEF76_01645 [Patescibacteria group bacterium]|nr:hypothetical protein [Patescibacteria group bacterium]